MRAEPEFPNWKMAKPPDVRKWLTAGAALILLSGSILLLRGVSGSGMMLTAMLPIMAIASILWLCRLVYYRASVHHRNTWNREIAGAKDNWWELHRSSFALRETILIGAAGSETEDWLRVLDREQRPPTERQEAEGKTFRIARTFSGDMAAREQQLARALVLQWKKTSAEPETTFSTCFWLGSNVAWQAFHSQMKISFPLAILPAFPEPWEGEGSLSRIAAIIRKNEATKILVAGCESRPARANSVLPAGDAAALWLIGADGPVLMNRGEVFDADRETAGEVCERALKQSDLKDVPDSCILFSHPEYPNLAASGWNLTHHLQDNYWGNVGRMEPLVVISLAALFAQHQEQPCCWIAADPHHTLASGIVKPHGKG